MCGNSTPNAETGMRKLKELKTQARSEGFNPISKSRHITIIVERQIDGLGAGSDLNVRHKLEDDLDQLLGWLGLGHCDGGATGSGSMEVFCMVVDAKIAIPAVNQALAATPDYTGFVARRVER
jgi:hypothetical protein